MRGIGPYSRCTSGPVQRDERWAHGFSGEDERVLTAVDSAVVSAAGVVLVTAEALAQPAATAPPLLDCGWSAQS